MLPTFFGYSSNDFFQPKLKKWWDFMNSEVTVAQDVREEIEAALKGWKESKRWDPIVLEMSRSI